MYAILLARRVSLRLRSLPPRGGQWGLFPLLAAPSLFSFFSFFCRFLVSLILVFFSDLSLSNSCTGSCYEGLINVFVYCQRCSYWCLYIVISVVISVVQVKLYSDNFSCGMSFNPFHSYSLYCFYIYLIIFITIIIISFFFQHYYLVPIISQRFLIMAMTNNLQLYQRGIIAFSYTILT